ncbi:hypothetical protein CYMTET_10220 [Cymbomonas tetramitiformis]|uniref:ZU5 domain-containing protein n=1 Tax=Cymbomonas tetramitiformis TaxID=36881 RepID=A0AAE0GQ36_9CHLO|nr:hypothetical protein CYMTET_10220 [Cymbomonas tetramitiformis]
MASPVRLHGSWLKWVKLGGVGSLNTLDLRNNDIGPEGAKALAVALTPNAEGVFNTSLNSITITNGVKLPIGALRRNVITELDLSGERLRSEDAVILGAVLVFNTSLNTLNLIGNNIGPKGAKALAVALTPNAEGVFNTSLNTLDLTYNQIGAEGAKALAVALAPNAEGVFNGSLNTLDLCANGIGPEGAKALAAALTPNEQGVFNTSLSTLDLGSNKIGPEGAKALAVALTPNGEGVFNGSLNTLDLRGNKIGVEGAEALAVVLTPNKQGVFNTSLNIVTITPGVELPIGALRRNELTELELSRKGLTREDAIILGAALVSNGSLNTLNVWGNELELEGARALADAVRQRNAPIKLCGSLLDVEELNLTDKRLRPGDALLLANDLVFNTSLNTLNLESHRGTKRDVTCEGVAFLKGAIVDPRCKLHTLNLGAAGVFHGNVAVQERQRQLEEHAMELPGRMASGHSWFEDDCGNAEAVLIQTISPQGGRLDLNGVILEIPFGALSEDTVIRMSLFPSESDATGLLEATSPCGPVVCLEPHNLQLARPATLKIPRVDGELDCTGFLVRSPGHPKTDRMGRWRILAPPSECEPSTPRYAAVKLHSFSWLCRGTTFKFCLYYPQRVEDARRITFMVRVGLEHCTFREMSGYDRYVFHWSMPFGKKFYMALSSSSITCLDPSPPITTQLPSKGEWSRLQGELFCAPNMIYLPNVRAIRQTLLHGETTKMGLMNVHKSEDAFLGTTPQWENLASVDVTLEFIDVPGNNIVARDGGEPGGDGPDGWSGRLGGGRGGGRPGGPGSGLEDTRGIGETGLNAEGDIGGSGGESGGASASGIVGGSAEPSAGFSSGRLDGEGQTETLRNAVRESHHGAAAAPAPSEARAQHRGNEGTVATSTTFRNRIQAYAATGARVVAREAVQLAVDPDFGEERGNVTDVLAEFFLGEGVAGSLGKLVLKGLSKTVGGIPGIFKYLEDNELLPLVYSDPTQAAT